MDDHVYDQINKQCFIINLKVFAPFMELWLTTFVFETSLRMSHENWFAWSKKHLFVQSISCREQPLKQSRGLTYSWGKTQLANCLPQYLIIFCGLARLRTGIGSDLLTCKGIAVSIKDSIIKNDVWFNCFKRIILLAGGCSDKKKWQRSASSDAQLLPLVQFYLYLYFIFHTHHFLYSYFCRGSFMNLQAAVFYGWSQP